MFNKVDPRQNFPEMERNVLEFWKKNKVFEESMEGSGKPTFSFYDGPPFATGLPHYGHVVASIIKDVVPRYRTMKGDRVDRRWGWDCHGLPVENLIEKELGLANKQAIEEMGVDKFNAACCSSVQRYAKEWKEFIPRVGRWVDMEDDYKTMDWKYTESIWWVFSEIYKKGLVYEGYKAMHLCPRCETTLANFEVTQGYKDITDLSATAKFKLTGESAHVILNNVKNPVTMKAIPGSFASAQDDTAGNDSNIYVLAWTTTPWTLPGNVALAVGKDIEYALVNYENENFILAKEKVETVFKDKAVELVKTLKGSELVGLAYEPLFSFYAQKEDLENRANGWKIYAADFVTTEEGVGVVHIAPAFGEDDMALGHAEKLPFIQHVSRGGKFVDFMDALRDEDKNFFVDKEGKGRDVKPKRNPRETDEKVVEYLKQENFLLSSENYKHSYPHCWRCNTPLLNYATSSWFVEVTKIKDRLVANNQQVNWTPAYIKDGRFGKWLEDARDWAISRSRFWGAALPIWRCPDCGELEVIGSIDELRAKTDKKITKFIVARHGQAESNINHMRSSKGVHHLTDEGKRQAERLAESLADGKIDMIIASPLVRAQETAGIVAGKLGLPVAENESLRELDFGIWDGFTRKELEDNNAAYQAYKAMPASLEKYNFSYGQDGESRADAEERVRNFIKECNEKYAGKNILVVAHGIVGAMFRKILDELDMDGYFAVEDRINFAEGQTFYVTNQGKAFDMHKPFIDEIKLTCSECGKPMQLVGDVFDCWFESGSMPYAQLHYPFENRDRFEAGYPADFIAEGIDQTRGWFYTLMVLSTALFDVPAFKNVIVNGIALAEDGQKMSKSLKNYPDPALVVEKYGADSLRYYLLTTPVMKAEDLRFSERGVDEVLKKFVLTLWNTYSFLVMNVELGKIEAKDIVDYRASDNLLDKWIMSELNLLVREVDREMQGYDLVKASRPLKDFVDKLSNWYLRRSRKRFASDDMEDRLAAYRTLRHVLVTFTKVMAPFMPFISEEIYKNLTEGKSVHLEQFPESSAEDIDGELSEQMELVREVVTLGLAVRAQNRLKVRMPLATLAIRREGIEALDAELIEILKDELNIKEVKVVSTIEAQEGWGISPEGVTRVALDLRVTEDLELEGMSREVIRQIQSMRKNAGYERDDVVRVRYELTETAPKLGKMFAAWTETIKSECLLSELAPEKEVVKEEFDGVGELEFDGEKIILVIKK